jgi:hypothetical protein
MSFGTERDNVGDGWQTIIEKLHADLLAIDPNYSVDQIKEKFGALRYYVTYDTDNDELRAKMDALIVEAENQSAVTCEWCGKPGKNSASNGWWITLCDPCREERDRKREERLKNSKIEHEKMIAEYAERKKQS